MCFRRDSGVPEFEMLYQEAVQKFGASSLRGIRRARVPTFADALAVAQRLRTNGDPSSHYLGQRIEQAVIAVITASISSDNESSAVSE